MPESLLRRSDSRAGLHRGRLVGCRVWETAADPKHPTRCPKYRFIKPLQMDNGLQYRWLVHERDDSDGLGIYHCLDDDFATLAEARESVDV